MITVSNQGHLPRSASGRSVHGTSDTAPRPSSATCSSSSSATHRSDGGLVCEQHPTHGSRRTTRTHEVHPGWFCRSGSSSTLACASLLRGRGKSPAVVVVACETSAPSALGSYGDKHPSTAICCPGPDQSESAPRTRGTRALAQGRAGRCAYATCSCRWTSRTDGASATPAVLFRIRCSAAGAASCPL